MTIPCQEFFDVFGVEATVTAPDAERPIETTAFWLPPTSVERPIGSELTALEPRYVMALKRAEVDEIPRGTLIDAPDVEGGDVKRWVVEEVGLRLHPDIIHVIVLPVEDGC